MPKNGRRKKLRASRASSAFDHRTLPAIAKLLGGYDCASVLSGLGGLQLLPSNGDRLLRFETAAQLAASLPERNGGIITQHRLLSLLNSPLFNSFEIGAQEDPHPDLFVDCLTLPSGSWRVFTGITEGYVFIIEHLGLALWHIDDIRNRPWVEEGRKIITATLRIGDHLAERAGLRRGTRVGDPHRGTVGAAQGSEFDRLRTSVRFSSDELHELLSDLGDCWSILSRLVAQPSGHPFDGSLEAFAGFPFCQIKDDLIIHLPHLILPALRHAIVRLAIEAGDRCPLKAAYADVVWDTCVSSLARLGNDYEEMIDLGALKDRGVRAARFSLDVDKKLYAILISDNLESYDLTNVFHASSEPDITTLLRAAITCCDAACDAAQSLFLFIPQGIGRDIQVDIEKLTDQPLLVLNADHLSTISWLDEEKDPLALWYFATALDRAFKAGLWAQSHFDLYSAYRKHKQSFYFGDEASGRGIVQPGFGRDLREQVQSHCDWHGARRPQDLSYYKLTSWCSQADTWPLYTPILSVREQVWILVEGFSIPIWVIGTTERNRCLHHHYAVLAETVAYWIWQLNSDLTDILRSANVGAPWTIWLYLSSTDVWETGRFPEEYRLPAIQVDARPRDGSMCLFIEPALASLALRDDNFADRSLIEALLEGFSRLIPAGSPLGELSIREQIVDRIAPRGRKKYFIVFDTTTPDVDNAGLPPARQVIGAVNHRVLDHLGRDLRGRNWSGWPTPKNCREDLLRDAVSILYQNLSKAVAALSPINLLERLIEHDEALLQKGRYLARTLGYKTECYGRNSDTIAEFSDTISSSSEAGIASRFLIEYVTTVPPQGASPLSISAYDELLAIASKIISIGMESDLLHFGIGDFDVGIVPSGRLGVGNATIQTAVKAFMQDLAGDEIARSIADSSLSFSQFGRRPASSRMDRIDQHSSPELGCSLSQLLEALKTVGNRASSFPSGVGVIKRRDLMNLISTELGVPIYIAEKVAAGLCLSVRQNFLEPTAPYSKGDVYPWHFNRALSYLRRPLVVRQRDGEEEIIFGKRHVFWSAAYLVELFLSGRFKAQTLEMKQVISEVRNEITQAFNDQVGEILAHNHELIVRLRINKVAGNRIGGPKNNLGESMS